MGTAAGAARSRTWTRSTASAVRVEPPPRIATLWRGLTTGDPAVRATARCGWTAPPGSPPTSACPRSARPRPGRPGYTGGEVPVGVLDTGVDADHPDLAGAVAESADFTERRRRRRPGRPRHPRRVDHRRLRRGVRRPLPRHGAGRPALQRQGVRVDAGAAESSIIAGMQWAARDKGLKVVNLSLGRRRPAGHRPARGGRRHADRAVRHAVRGRGRQRRRAGSVGSPASADAALAVGAGTRGRHGGRLLQPGTAGGRRRGSSRTSPRPGWTSSPPAQATRRLPAAPAARRVQPRSPAPRWPRRTWPARPRSSRSSTRSGARPRLKAALMSAPPRSRARPPTGRAPGGSTWRGAVSSPVTAAPGSLYFGSQAAPRTVTYYNSGTSAITLALSVVERRLRRGRPDGHRAGPGEATVIVTADVATGRVNRGADRGERRLLGADHARRRAPTRTR